MTEPNGDVSPQGAVQQVLTLREKARKEIERLEKSRDKVKDEIAQWERFLEVTEDLQDSKESS